MAWTLCSAGASLLTVVTMAAIAPPAEAQQPPPPDPRVAATLGFVTPLATLAVGGSLILGATTFFPQPQPAFSFLVLGGILSMAAPVTAVAGARYAGDDRAIFEVTTLGLVAPVVAGAAAALIAPSAERYGAALVPLYIGTTTLVGLYGGWTAWQAARDADQ